MLWNILLVSLGQLSQLYPLPTSYLSPVYGLLGAGGREKALTLCKQVTCLAIAKTLVGYHGWSRHKCKAQHRTGCCEESTLHYWFVLRFLPVEMEVISGFDL